MPLQQSSQYSNNFNNQQGGGEKKKRNFIVGGLYATGGRVEVSTWRSEKGGYYVILTIKSEIGKDPSTGAGVYQNKMSSELPSVLFNVDTARALIDSVRSQDINNINIVLDTGRGSKITCTGNATSIKVTVDNSAKGSATVTFDAVPTGVSNVHAGFLNLIELIEIGFKKALRNRTDPEEFSSTSNESDDEAPF